MNDAEKKPELQGKLREFLVMRNLYEAAARQLTLKFEILNDEFSVLYARNPIHHIESRVKTPESIAAKLMKKGMPVSIEPAREHVNDIAGVRVVCSYIDDVYRVAEMLERQKDIEIVKRQDYIKTPNYNGYRSLHLDIRVPVYLSDRTEYVVAEIQIRTIAMDFWASLEHVPPHPRRRNGKGRIKKRRRGGIFPPRLHSFMPFIPRSPRPADRGSPGQRSRNTRSRRGLR